ncbi:MAG: acyl--CoA ligase [Clostridia bacterium]|nr:acyl--CoA ligase [Clostridia bacterium]
MRDLSGFSVYEILEQSAASYPDRTAWDFLGFKMTYSDFIRNVNSCATKLKSLGIKKGEIVSLLLPNIPASLILFYAVSKIGAVSNFIHPQMPVSQISSMLLSMNPAHIWVPGFMVTTIKELKILLPDTHIHPVKMHSFMPFHLMIGTYLKYLPSHIINITKGRRYFSFNHMPATEKADSAPSETSVILLTGGTDGTPKGVCLSSEAVNQAAASTAAVKTPSDTQDRMLAILPVFHGYGLVNCIHTTFAEAACLILLPYYNERLFKNVIRQKKPGYMLGIPRLYSRMADLFENEDLDMSFFKGLYCGGSKLTDSVREKINCVLRSKGARVVVREGYGLTECVGACLLMPEDHYRPGSVGIPYPGVSVGIIKPGTEEFLDCNIIGEIAVSSKMIMNGYFNGWSGNIFEKDGFKWLRTGDLGSMDQDGFVYFTDRIKRMVKIAGYEVYPGKIESYISQIPGIVNCCVVESEKDGLSVLKAFIVADTSFTNDKTKDEILRILNKKLPGWSVPGELIFVDSIPETLMKKNAYRELAQ